MGFIDNIVAAVSPKAAYEREVYKIAVEGLRSFDSYDAGSYERNNRNWHAVNESAEITDRYNRDTIRARARDLERNSDIMNSITSAWKRNIIGSGFILQAKTPDVELNKQIEKAWKKWCKKQNCDVTQTQSLNQMLRMAVNRKKIDGGIRLGITTDLDHSLPHGCKSRRQVGRHCRLSDTALSVYCYLQHKILPNSFCSLPQVFFIKKALSRTR